MMVEFQDCQAMLNRLKNRVVGIDKGSSKE